MRIEHIAVYYNDLEKARDFYVRCFGAESNDGYHNKTTGFRSYFLTFEGGARLEIMTKPVLDQEAKPLNRTGWAHIALALGSREAVDTLTAKLIAGGCAHVSGPRTTGDGYYESCILDFEGNQIELTE